MTICLNCGATLHGPFCSTCGQRAVPANPTVAELAGDAWQELSGYDGRLAATARGLLRPGFLTREYAAGRRARHLSPVRLYLTVSVMYFLAAAATPPDFGPRGTATMPGGIHISVTNGAPLSADEREKLLATVERAPWVLRPLLRSAVIDPAALRARVLAIMPRVFFALLPVFAAIVAMFYRGRPFPTSLVFAVHLHAFAFTAFTLSELVKLTGSSGLARTVGVATALGFAVYALSAFHTVFGGGWPVTIAKAAGIGIVYLIASMPAFAIILIWASLT